MRSDTTEILIERSASSPPSTHLTLPRVLVWKTCSKRSTPRGGARRRGTSLKVFDCQTIRGPEVRLSGPAVYAFDYRHAFMNPSRTWLLRADPISSHGICAFDRLHRRTAEEANTVRLLANSLLLGTIHACVSRRQVSVRKIHPFSHDSRSTTSTSITRSSLAKTQPQLIDHSTCCSPKIFLHPTRTSYSLCSKLVPHAHKQNYGATYGSCC